MLRFTYCADVVFALTQHPNTGLGHLTVAVSSSQTHSVGLLRQIYQPVSGDVAYTTLNKDKRRISLPSTEFKPSIPGIKRLQTYEIDSVASGISHHSINARYYIATLCNLSNRLS